MVLQQPITPLAVEVPSIDRHCASSSDPLASNPTSIIGFDGSIRLAFLHARPVM